VIEPGRGARLLAAGAVALLAAAIVVPGISVPLHNIAEPLEGLVVREMADSGDWILPRRNGEEIPAKPPLYHWTTIGLAALLGRSIDEVAIRVTSVAASACAVGATFLAASPVFGATAAAVASLAVATSPEWVEWAGMARTDALFVALLTVALFAGERWLVLRSRAPLFLAAFALGGAALAKGPAAFVLAGAVLAVELVRRGELRRLLAADVWLAAAIALALPAAWYAAAIARGGAAFFQKQILAENVFRFLPTDDGGPSREHGIFFYVPALLGGMFPWVLVLPLAVRDAWREEGRRASLARFATVWIAVVFVLCSLANGKRANYVLPLYPAAGVLIGATLERWIRAGTGEHDRALALTAALVAVPLVLLGVLALFWTFGFEPWTPILPFLHPRDRANIPLTAEAIGRPPLVVGLGALALAAALVVAWSRRRFDVLASVIAVVTLGIVFFGTAVVRPVEASLKTFRPFAERVSTRLADDSPAAFYRRPEYAVLFYLGRHVPVEYVDPARLPRPGWAFVWEEDWDRFREGVGAEAEVVETSQPASRSRPGSRLLLVRLDGTRR
jgi:4-amino-4-deoxy-L-arabinose transferase-like glycosyltransferase